MSTNYAGSTSNYPAQIQIPSDGDVRDAASVNAAFQGLADRTNTIYTWRNGKVRFPAGDNSSRNPGPRWTYNRDPVATDYHKGWIQTNITDQGWLEFPIHLPPGHKITKFGARVKGDHTGTNKHGANLPGAGDIAAIRMLAVDDTGSWSLYGVDDSSGTVTAYEQDHDIEYTFSPSIEYDDMSLFFIMLGEQGANAVADALLMRSFYVILEGIL